MCVTANDQLHPEWLEQRQEAVLGCQPREVFVFVPRRPVTKEHVAHSWNLNAQRLRPARQNVRVLGRQFLRCPSNDLSCLFRERFRVCAGALFEHGDFAVALNEMDGEIQLEQARDRLPEHRPWQDIASNHYAVNVCALNLLRTASSAGRLPWMS